MAMRCLLIRSNQSGRTYLIDNGAGEKFSSKMAEIYSLDYEHSNLISSLREAGTTPDDITDVIFTHLHFDHCGGTTWYDSKGELKERFPNARYHIHRRHLSSAQNPNEREGASFLPENLDPILQSGRIGLADDGHTFEEGLETRTVDGHTEGQLLPLLIAGNQKILFAGDLIPTHAHLPMPWIMGYDMHARQTLQEKRQILEEAVADNWYLFLEHDAFYEMITVTKKNGTFSLERNLTLSRLGV
ncbi:MAG: MBL fold metallo-hydrolase, partial [Balneolaceae bacterium]